MRYLLTGDIRHPGKIEVEAATLDQALDRADDGDFEVFDEQGKPLAFDWDGIAGRSVRSGTPGESAARSTAACGRRTGGPASGRGGASNGVGAGVGRSAPSRVGRGA